MHKIPRMRAVRRTVRRAQPNSPHPTTPRRKLESVSTSTLKPRDSTATTAAAPPPLIVALLANNSSLACLLSLCQQSSISCIEYGGEKAGTVSDLKSLQFISKFARRHALSYADSFLPHVRSFDRSLARFQVFSAAKCRRLVPTHSDSIQHACAELAKAPSSMDLRAQTICIYSN